MKSATDNRRELSEIKDIVSNKSDEITIHENLLSYPVKNASAGYDFEGGLIDSKTMELTKEAILIRYGKSSQTMPQLNSGTETGIMQKAEGIFLFGGILFNNFGHFLLESIGRLWAYDLFKKFDPYILFYVPWNKPDYYKRDNYVYQLFKGFNIPVKRIIFLDEITQLKNIIIPKQKYGFGLCKNPDTTFINFIKSFKTKNHLPKKYLKADKIYVSRSKLPFSQGRPLGETMFENHLQENGYLILYPEKKVLYEQLAIYKNAKKIIFCDGGAYYATILLPELNADIAIIARRRDDRWNYKEMTQHFYGYKKSILWIDEVVGQYQFGLETWDAAAEIDWNKVSTTLEDKGFIETTFEKMDSADYRNKINRELQEYIKSIEAKPLFLHFMQKHKNQFPILPASF